MITLIKLFFILFSFYASSTLARNGCRRCTGTYTFTLDKGLNEAAARDRLATSLGTCATGKQYLVKAVRSVDCKNGVCNQWAFDLTIYRYCGNGSKVLRAKDRKCTSPTGCFFGDYLQLNCVESVDCAETCHCWECAC